MPQKNNLSDEELVNKIKNGDLDAFTFLIKRYEHKLLRYASFLCFNQNLIDDIVQNSFIKAYQNLNQFDEQKKFSSWIYRIVHNESINQGKKANHEVIIEDLQWLSLASNENILNQIEKEEKSTRLKNILQTMPTKYLEVLWLHYFEEKSYQEIAEILKLNISLVGVRINRGKKMIKKILTEENL